MAEMKQVEMTNEEAEFWRSMMAERNARQAAVRARAEWEQKERERREAEEASHRAAILANYHERGPFQDVPHEKIKQGLLDFVQALSEQEKLIDDTLRELAVTAQNRGALARLLITSSGAEREFEAFAQKVSMQNVAIGSKALEVLALCNISDEVSSRAIEIYGEVKDQVKKRKVAMVFSCARACVCYCYCRC